MRKLTIEDVFISLAKPLPEFEIKPKKTALLLIDMQTLINSEQLLQDAVSAGLPEKEVREALREYDQRVKKAVKNAQKILLACRKKGYDLVHIKLEAQTNDPRHTAKVNRKADFIVPMGSEKARFLPEVKPIKGELIFPKTNGGAFTGTNLDFVLRNMDIDSIIVTGFLTDQCVLATSLHAADLGYDVLIVEDACTTRSKTLHDAVLLAQKDVCAKIKTTDDVERTLRKL